MQKLFLYLLLILIPSHIATIKTVNAASHASNTQIEEVELAEMTDSQQLYAEMGLEGMVNFTAFEQALNGYKQIDRQKEIMTLIDFTKPSTEERLYVFDMSERKLLFSSHVSHGKNSGDKYAKHFSNELGSYKSSLGFYITENTYNGRNGYSLVLNGLEKGINHRAKERAIVIHGARYSNTSTITSTGRLGRSLGCPALPQKVSKPIIDTIKKGSVLYIYADSPEYTKRSNYISTQG